MAMQLYKLDQVCPTGSQLASCSPCEVKLQPLGSHPATIPFIVQVGYSSSSPGSPSLLHPTVRHP